MKLGKDRRGFSLVELIIVMAIMGLLSGVTAAAMGYINTGKTKKSSAKLDGKLDYIQTETMTKEGNAYLYLYAANDGIYTYVHTAKLSDPNPTGFNTRLDLDTYMTSNSAKGSKICDGTVTATAKGTKDSGGNMEMKLTSSNMLKVGYSKSTGAFIYSNDGDASAVDFYNLLELKGKQTFKIKMIKATGKHFVKEA